MNPNKKHKENLKPLDKIALFITNAVGTMWCAFVFMGLALVSLPQAIQGGAFTLVSWISQTFLQLVLLSVIMVGQNLQSRHAETVADHTYELTKKIDKIIEKKHEVQTRLRKK